MKLTKKERKIFEENFNFYEDSNTIELEAWTNGGVDMLIYLDKEEETTATTQFINYIDNFDIDEEIDIYRQDIRYKNAFSITESVKDFENWLIWLKEIENQLTKEKTKSKKKL